MKIKDLKNKCWHTEEFHYEDEDGDECCEKCDDW